MEKLKSSRSHPAQERATRAVCVEAGDFRPIPSAPSHEINKLGVVRRRLNPAPGGDGSLCQFRPGYAIRGAGNHVLLSQNGKVLRNTTRRSLVLEAFGQAWEKRYCRGERVKQSKLTAAQVIEIRGRKATGESDASIAADFGICRNNVYYITSRRSWKHLD